MGIIGKTKEMINFSIDTNLKAKFIEVANKQHLNRSSLLSSLIENWLKENKD